jgi:hypothetical protein
MNVAASLPEELGRDSNDFNFSDICVRIHTFTLGETRFCSIYTHPTAVINPKQKLRGYLCSLTAASSMHILLSCFTVNSGGGIDIVSAFTKCGFIEAQEIKKTVAGILIFIEQAQTYLISPHLAGLCGLVGLTVPKPWEVRT